MREVKRREKADAKSTDSDFDVKSQTAEQMRRIRPAAATGAGGPVAVLRRKIPRLASRDKHYHRALLRDVLSGALLGASFLVLLVFLDCWGAVPLGLARAFRHATFDLLSDPEAVRSLERNGGVKFVPLEIVRGMNDEIARSREQLKDTSVLDERKTELRKKKEELATLMKEYEAVKETADRALGLDRWCGQCTVAGRPGWGLCDVRVGYLWNTYKTSPIETKLEIMAEGKCLLPEARAAAAAGSVV